MSKQTWIIASVLSGLAVLGFAFLSFTQQGHNLDRAKAELAQLRAQIDQARVAMNTLKGEVADSKSQIDELRREKDAATQAQHSLEQEMRNSLESKDITISELQGKLTVNILDRIMFNSGEAELKPEGEKVLQKIAGVLAQYPKRQIHVIGHTDNVPIRSSARSRFASNWELSTARATAAVRYLCEKANVEPRRLGAVGYGEFHPIADNSTADGRAKNRRIALVVLSDELVGADTAAPALASTNAPPASVQTNQPIREAANTVPAVTNTPPLVAAEQTNEVTAAGEAQKEEK